MSVRTLTVVSLIGISLAWCAGASAGDKPKTGFVNKTFTDKKGKKVAYVVYVPKGYDGKKVYPVILSLHGGGEKNPVPWGLGTYIKARGDLDFLCVFPHTEDGWAPGTRGDKHAIGALDEVMAQYKADRRRVYLTGFSMGGRGTWSLGAKYADRWAALVPVAADSRPEWAQKVKDIPIWAFHGSDDRSELNAAKGRQAVAYVKKLGGKPKYTELPGGGHEPDHAYHNDELYAWLRKQSKNPSGAGRQAAKSRAEFQGTWSGNWENTLGDKGAETVILEESAEGLLSGTYGDSKIKGERVGKHTFSFEALTASHRYRVVGRVEGKKLHLDYSANPLDGGRRYYGVSILERVN
jgi:pimeloyl-ACP methyl ester carboxylesterase